MTRLWLALVAPALLSGHALTVEVQPAAPAVVLRASYDNAEPAGRADVSVFRPGDSASPYQTGSTDAAGTFAFVPSQSGTWLAVIDDGFGHRSETTVEWTGGKASLESRSGPAPWQNALTGVALLIGLTGIWLWRQSRDFAARNRQRP
jgi:nickel transport protein